MTNSPVGIKNERFLLSVGMTINPLGIKDKTMAASPPLFYPPLFRTSPSFRLEGGIPITAEPEVIPTDSAERNLQLPQRQKSFQPAVQRGIPITTETEVIPTDSAERNPRSPRFTKRSRRYYNLRKIDLYKIRTN